MLRTFVFVLMSRMGCRKLLAPTDLRPDERGFDISIGFFVMAATFSSEDECEDECDDIVAQQ